MQLTNEQVQAILDGAPEGVQHYDIGLDAYYYDQADEIPICLLREILQLRQEVERLREPLKLIQIEGGLGIARHRQIDRVLVTGE